ncbi:MAG: exodeoxyribonuclease III [Pseudomonadota bacterium]|nr:exodeoxyribonuclease III [Pseudomonadota bacterium]
MTVATININDVVRRLPALLTWLEREAPDIVCMQEIKVEDAKFPAGALAAAGYGAVWRGQKRWHGVAILARGSDPIPTRRALPGDPDDHESRYIEAAVEGVLIGCLYLPNGNPQPGPKFDYKLAWFERLSAHAASLLEAAVPVVLAGDYNVVPTNADIYSPRSFLTNALLQPAPRAAYRRLLEQGWTDAIATVRSATPPDADPAYTFWSYDRDRWARNAGLRLDHLLLSPSLAPRLRDAGVDRWVRGLEGASDHAPAWVKLGM